MGWWEPYKSHQESAKVLHQNGKSSSAALELAGWGAALPKGPGIAAGERGSLLSCGIRYTFRKVTVSLCSAPVKLHIGAASSLGFKLEGAQEKATKLVKQQRLS